MNRPKIKTIYVVKYLVLTALVAFMSWVVSWTADLPNQVAFTISVIGTVIGLDITSWYANVPKKAGSLLYMLVAWVLLVAPMFVVSALSGPDNITMESVMWLLLLQTITVLVFHAMYRQTLDTTITVEDQGRDFSRLIQPGSVGVEPDTNDSGLKRNKL